jgi:hypothetical protein
MINLISNENIANINTVASSILALLKAKKFFFTSEYNDDSRIKASNSLLELSRAFSEDHIHRMNSVKASTNEERAELEALTATLCDLLENKMRYTCQKIKDYSGDIKPKLCRELVSYLEDMLIMGEINLSDIEDVYAAINKPVPKKYKKETLSVEGYEVYRAIRSAINDNAQEIKANSVEHYIDMVNRIDPNDDIDNKKAFLKACWKKLSDPTTIMLCMASKFSSEKFQDMINEAFDNLVLVAASKITDHYRGTNEKPLVDVRSIEIGGKGFDLVIRLDNQLINARAIPVEGYFVRFHYRYIIT